VVSVQQRRAVTQGHDGDEAIFQRPDRLAAGPAAAVEIGGGLVVR
jgi:hypothetical protein